VEDAQSRAPVARLLDVEACTLEQLCDEPADVVVVVDDQNATAVVHTAFIPIRTRVCYRRRRESYPWHGS
jgi:hypothetical protein